MTLSMWTVYDHPRDFPEHFVAREFRIHPGRAEATSNIIQSEDLEVIRTILLTEMGKMRLMRSPHDDPKIVETWL
jgi:hypothetical protein